MSARRAKSSDRWPGRRQLAPGLDYDPDEQTIEVVAYRLIKSTRWLRYLIGAPEFQYHHHLGRSPRWSESEFQSLRAAKIAADAARSGRPVSGSKLVADIGTFAALYGPR